MPLNTSTNLTAHMTNILNISMREICNTYLNIREETPTGSSLKLAAYAVAFVLAVIGNSLIIVIVLRKSRFKTTTNLFIVNMASSDVLMAFICMPTTMYSIATKNRGEMIFKGIVGLLSCKLLPFLQGLSIAVSILTLSTLAAERFLAIVYPFDNFISKSRAKILIAAVWIVGAIFNAPMLYSMTFYEKGSVRVCYENWEPYFNDDKASKDYTIVMFVVLYALPLCLLVFFYTALIKELWRGGRLHSNQTRAFSENKSVLKMVLTVIVTFAVCWLPVHVIVFVVLFTSDVMIRDCGFKPSIIFIGWFMGHVNSSINPIIYFTFNEHFRREVFKMLRLFNHACLRRKRASSERSLPMSARGSVIQQTHNTSVSSNEDKNAVTGKANEAFEMPVINPDGVPTETTQVQVQT